MVVKKPKIRKIVQKRYIRSRCDHCGNMRNLTHYTRGGYYICEECKKKWKRKLKKREYDKEYRKKKKKK